MTDKQLINLADAGITETVKYDKDSFDKVAKSGAYLGRIQLMTSRSGEVEAGRFAANHYAHIADKNHDDLGKSVDVLVVAWRPKALDMNDGVHEVYDQESSEFQRIEKKAGTSNSQCMFGPEFLLYVPSVKKFALFFMGTASARRESGNLIEHLQGAATLTSQYIETPKFKWHAPKIEACSEELDTPDKAELKKWYEDFANPKVDEREAVTDDDNTGREV